MDPVKVARNVSRKAKKRESNLVVVSEKHQHHRRAISTLNKYEVADLILKTFPKKDYANKFLKNGITGEDFMSLEKDDLRAIGVTKFNHMRRIMALKIQDLWLRDEDMLSSSDSKRVTHVSSWKIKRIPGEMREDKKGTIGVRHLLTWQSMRSAGDKEFSRGEGTSNFITAYNLRQAVIDDGKNLYSVKEDLRNPSQKLEELEEIIREMRNNENVRVEDRKKAYMTMDMDIVQIDVLKERFQISCTVNIFWHDPSILEEQRAISLVEKGVPAENEATFPIVVTYRGKDSTPVSADRLFADAFESSIDIFARTEHFAPKTGIVHGTYKVKATIKQSFDLFKFPLDRQILQVFVFTKSLVWEFVEEPPKEWGIESKYTDVTITVCPSARVEAEYKCFPPCAKVENRRGGMWFGARVERYQTYYIVTAVLPMFLITLYAGAAFLFTRLLEGRITLVIRVSLTIVAFRLWMSGILPVISYVTYMDIYLLSSYVLVAYVAVEAVVVSYNDFVSAETALYIDLLSGICFLCIWCGINIGYAIAAITGWMCTPWEKLEKQNLKRLERHVFKGKTSPLQPSHNPKKGAASLPQHSSLGSVQLGSVQGEATEKVQV